MTNAVTLGTSASQTTQTARSELLQLLRAAPLPDREFLQNLGLFAGRNLLQRMLVLNDLYQRIVNVHGVVMEFGVRWGQNLSLFTAFRGIYEPFNFNRKVIGFDTFQGFPSVHAKDGDAEVVKVGAYAVAENYEQYLAQILRCQEAESPYEHLIKNELVVGDVVETLPQYLAKNPETIVALAYFDLDLYEPTKQCLLYLRDRLTKGSVLAFDELNHPSFPGETLAVKETLGLGAYAIRRSPLNPNMGFLVID
jgi:hypothetical protein